MARSKTGRYEVTGPGLEGVFYADDGPAISRTVTEASKTPKGVEATFYVRDALGDKIVGYSERDKLGHITTRRNR